VGGVLTTRRRFGPTQLRHYLYRMVAAELGHHRANGSEWLFPEELSAAEQEKLLKMLDSLVTDFDVKAEELGQALLRAEVEPIP
jgi:hypothetical protein